MTTSTPFGRAAKYAAAYSEWVAARFAAMRKYHADIAALDAANAALRDADVAHRAAAARARYDAATTP